MAVRDTGRRRVLRFSVLSRGREGPARFLGNFEGTLQTDDYIAYERGIGGPKMVHAACWAHPRRRFVDAVKLNRQDAASIRAVKLMDELFAIDREASEAQMDYAPSAAPGQLRLCSIRSGNTSSATSKTVLPESAAGKACSHTLALWPKLIRFLNHPQLELSNNLAENSMRPVAIGRKTGSSYRQRAGWSRVAAILSVVAAAARDLGARLPRHYPSRGSPTRPSSASTNSHPLLGSTRGHSPESNL